MKQFYICISTFFVLLIVNLEVFATHIRAGEITAVRVSGQSLIYRFTITGYTDTGSSVQFGPGEIDFGDGTPPLNLDTEKDFSVKRPIGDPSDQVAINEFYITHQFPSPGTYTIRFREFNRNGGVLNMDNSVNTPFYIETQIVIDPFFGLNNTPLLLVPPIDKAATGATFFHNPGAYDPDGDSLAYKMVIPKQNIDYPVDNYRQPNNASFYMPPLDYNTANQDRTGPPTFTLDALTGDLVWDAPGLEGEYNIAFIVEEWRKINGKWYQLGYVTRDMQIIVEDTDNEPPVLYIPKDTCIVAGTRLQGEIKATDPDNHEVKIETFGGVYKFPVSPATFTPNPAEYQSTTPPDSARLFFDWLTDCSQIREAPYQIQFKATDNPPIGPSLAALETWNVRVVGPAPTGLKAAAQPGKSVSLAWDNYTCSNADRIQIWRKVGSFEFTPENCETGIPENAGYELIGEVPANLQGYLDDNNGNGLEVGGEFCYRIVAVFPLPGGGESYASEEVCVQLAVDVPVITNVSIEKTGTNNGEIYVRWIQPFEINKTMFPPPYQYEVLRADGFNGDNISVVRPRSSDTTFLDTGLNTLNNVYNYRIVLFDASGAAIDTSAVASTVRLEAVSQVKEIDIEWTADVPWSNQVQNYPFHYIYRDNVNPANPQEIVLIDSVNVTQNGYKYNDLGQFNGIELSENSTYCYYVLTQGSYGNPGIFEPLRNKSQVVCAQPNDTIPPCTPLSLLVSTPGGGDCTSFLQSKSCNFEAFSNTIRWNRSPDGECDSDVRNYNLYFSRSGEEGTYEKIATVSDTFFIHNNLTSFAGCYRISAVDRSGNESEISEPICIDNCPFYMLPNVFTPNDDTKNDVFSAYNDPSPENNTCPRFVESVNFKVYNRWGKEVYSYNSNDGVEGGILINWDGRSSEGIKLSTGVYYYHAKVTFTMLDPSNSVRDYKGWVHILK